MSISLYINAMIFIMFIAIFWSGQIFGADKDSFGPAIAANPDDALPRLVYADWEEENGGGNFGNLIRASQAIVELESRLAELTDSEWATLFLLRNFKQKVWVEDVADYVAIKVSGSNLRIVFPYFAFYGGTYGRPDMRFIAQSFLNRGISFDRRPFQIKTKDVDQEITAEEIRQRIPLWMRNFDILPEDASERRVDGKPYPYAVLGFPTGYLQQLANDKLIDENLEGLFINWESDLSGTFQPSRLKFLYVDIRLPTRESMGRALEVSARNQSVTHFAMSHAHMEDCRYIFRTFPKIHSFYASLLATADHVYLRQFREILDKSQVRELTVKVPEWDTVDGLYGGASRNGIRMADSYYNNLDFLNFTGMRTLKSLHLLINSAPDARRLTEKIHQIAAHTPELISLELTIFVGERMGGPYDFDEPYKQIFMLPDKLPPSLKFFRIRLMNVSENRQQALLKRAQEFFDGNADKFAKFNQVSLALSNRGEEFAGRKITDGSLTEASFSPKRDTAQVEESVGPSDETKKEVTTEASSSPQLKSDCAKVGIGTVIGRKVKGVVDFILRRKK